MVHIIDPAIKEAGRATPRQAEFIDAVNEHGSQAAAALALGVSQGNISDAVKAVKARAAVHGYSPEHGIVTTIAPGYVGKGHSTLERVNEDGSRTPILQWTKTKADEEARAKLIEAAFVSAAASLPRLPPLAREGHGASELCNLVTFSDYHLGLLARGNETGGDWSVEIAEAMLVAAFDDMLQRAPRAGVCVLNVQGDMLHFDSLLPVTPTHGHVLDADGSFSRMVKAAIRVLRRLCDLALMLHDEVHVVMVSGNHDLASMVWLRHMFTALYELEPRLTVNDSETPYYAYQFGKVMLGIHHGHKKKGESLPLLFAARYPVMWGATTKRYCHTGHWHHEKSQEFAGMKWTQHPTLAPADKHSSDGGWDSERAAILFTYHARFGEIGSTVTTPEMLAA